MNEFKNISVISGSWKVWPTNSPILEAFLAYASRSTSREFCISDEVIYEPCTPFTDEEPNLMDVDDSLKRICNNSPSLKELNLNNIEVSYADQFKI